MSAIRHQERTEERVFFVQALVCIVPNCGRAHCENTHGNPLCRLHGRLHRESFHALGRGEAFEARWLEHHGLTWALCTERTDDIWQARGRLYVTLAKADGRYGAWLERQPELTSGEAA